MKILLVNKFYYPRDGVSNYVLELEKKLKEAGHEVHIFAMADPQNTPCPDQKYFVSNLSLHPKNLKDAARAAGRIFYSREAKRKFTALIKDHRPDIIHIHNIYHQISPSILAVAKTFKIPVVMHLHDYKLICPNYKLFVKGKVCRRCRGGKYYNCLLNNCLHDSRLESLGGTLEMYFQHAIWPIYKTGVNLFIAPSRAMEKTVVDFGWPKEKIKFLCNFFPGRISEGDSPAPAAGNYLLYFGRLAAEKGVATTLEALTLNQKYLKIAGTGPEEKNLRALTEKLKLEKRVEFLGFKTGQELEDLIAGAKAIIIPSIWLENMSLSLLEALAHGQAVIAANIGGIPEIIKDGQNGWLFSPGDSRELAEKIKLVAELTPAKKTALSAAARASVKDFNSAEHLREILKIYQAVINGTKNNR
jgi:glycosyltransferase involved in cell wall biosynthesis